MAQIREALAQRRPFEGDILNYRKDGETFWNRLRIQPLFADDGTLTHFVGSQSDITENKLYESRLLERTKVLGLVAANRPLEEIYAALIDKIEGVAPDMLGSLLLLDPDRNRLQNAVSNRLPEFYNRAIDGLEIGADVGSCGAAAFAGQRVIVEDVQSHPFWEKFRELAKAADIQACWSEPILDSGGAVLGTFAVYARTPRSPSPTELDSLATAARLAAVAIERNHADRELRESEERFRKLADSTPAVIWMSDVGMKIVWVSQQWADFTREAIETDFGDAWVSRLHPDDSQRVVDNFASAHASQQAFQNVCRVKRHDGQWRWFYAQAIPRRADDGRFIGFVGSALDITEQKQAELSLAESQTTFHQLADNLQQVFWLADQRKPELIYVSPAYEKIWGRTCESAYRDPLSFVEGIHPDDRARIVDSVSRQIKGEATDETYRVVRPDGELRWVRDRAFPFRDDTGNVYRVAGLADDITEIKLAEDALRASEAHLADAQRIGRIGSWEWHLVSGEVWWSDELYRLLGVEKDAFHPSLESFLELVVPEDRQSIRDYLNLALEDGETFVISYRIKGTDGSLRYHNCEGQLERNEKGKPVCLRATVRDNTERQRVQMQLRRAERLASLGTLAAGIAHEINNPMSAAWTAASTAQELKDHPEARGMFAECLDAVVSSVQRCQVIIENVLRFARKESSEKKPCDLNDIVRQAITTTNHFVKQHECEIELNLAEDLPPLTVNVAEIEQVVVNMIRNAIQAGQATRISLSTVKGVHFARIIVADNGQGISEENLDRIFDPFFTVGPTPETGTGLGLSISHGIIQDHGGRIDVESELGRGTKFAILLPLRNPARIGLHV